MAYIPKDAQWFLAELIEEIRVQDDSRNMVWRNLTLIRADSAGQAYEKALQFGRKGDTEYDNPNGKRVTSRFRGISQLDVIHDELEDGAELSFHSELCLSEEQIDKLLCAKDQLGVFRPQRRLDGPDVASAEVLEEVKKRFGIVRPEEDSYS